ncbi:MAG TPA: glycosyltransferase [Candidatus Cloacimonadota bacterium]|nr:glycosyltransferase [Candidatus Cloacimonadales bacterium]HPY96977.1 glycosyltransferase [Candidatus Cloacimonadota bacterium]HQB41099.1 glycosyltransferase [Candidatus Cloacimonadota bacterium]
MKGNKIFNPTIKCMANISIITNSHQPDDSRVYHKIALSLTKSHFVQIIYSHKNIKQSTENVVYTNINTSSKASFLKKSLKHIVDFNTDLIICVEPFTLVIGNIAQKHYKIPFIYDCHEFFAEAFEDRFKYGKLFLKALYSFLERSLYKKAKGVITVNNILVEQMKKYNKNTICCANYPLLDEIESNIREKEYDLIYIGGISENRGLTQMLKIVKEAKEKNRPLTLIIIGTFLKGNSREEVDKVIEKYNISNQITIINHIPSNEIPSFIQKSRIGLSLLDPNTKRYQNALPLKLLEYMKEGVPVIANNFPIVRNVVDSYKSGICIEYSVNEGLDAINKLLNNSELYNTYAQNAKQAIKHDLNWQAEEAKLLAFIDKAINE